MRISWIKGLKHKEQTSVVNIYQNNLKIDVMKMVLVHNRLFQGLYEKMLLVRGGIECCYTWLSEWWLKSILLFHIGKMHCWLLLMSLTKYPQSLFHLLHMSYGITKSLILAICNLGGQWLMFTILFINMEN